MRAGRGAPQLTLGLFDSPAHDFASFVVGPNGEACGALKRWAAGTGPRVILLRGAHASGKSHLLEAAVRAVERGRAMLVPLRTLAQDASSVLNELDDIEFLALDDIDSVAGRLETERALFNVYNAAAAGERRLLWSVTSAAGFSLADLSSRLAAGLAYNVRELGDSGKADVLVAEAARRGLQLSPAVVDFILQRERRDLATLLVALDRLDRATLARGRAPSVPFVRAVLSEEA